MKVFERILWVDADYNPKMEMPGYKPDVRGSYEAVMHALIGDCVFWGTSEMGYHKKIKVTVEILGTDVEVENE